MRIILASASPRRRELLEQIHIPFEVCVSHVEEHITSKEPQKIVEELSGQKAEAVLDSFPCEGELIVIGADTVVAADGHIMGKPANPEEAVSIWYTPE
jgi:septum formation protein